MTDQTSANTSQPKIVIDVSLDDYTHSTGYMEDPLSAIGNKLMYVIIALKLTFWIAILLIFVL